MAEACFRSVFRFSMRSRVLGLSRRNSSILQFASHLRNSSAQDAFSPQVSQEAHDSSVALKLKKCLNLGHTTCLGDIYSARKETENFVANFSQKPKLDSLDYHSNELNAAGPPKISPDDFYKISSILEKSLRQFFIKSMDYSIYHPQIQFINNIRGKTTIGLDKYMQQASLLRTVGHLKFAFVIFDVMNMHVNPQEYRITVRWRIKGLSGIKIFIKLVKHRLWNPRDVLKFTEDWFDGISYFDIGDDGLIHRHIADKIMEDEDRVASHNVSKNPLDKLGVLASKTPSTSFTMNPISADSKYRLGLEDVTVMPRNIITESTYSACKTIRSRDFTKHLLYS